MLGLGIVGTIIVNYAHRVARKESLREKITEAGMAKPVDATGTHSSKKMKAFPSNTMPIEKSRVQKSRTGDSSVTNVSFRPWTEDANRETHTYKKGG